MMKKPFWYDDEIDLTNLFKIIWNGKIKIVLITIISFLIGSIYAYQFPDKNQNSLVIKLSNNTEIKKFLLAHNSLKIIEAYEFAQIPGNNYTISKKNNKEIDQIIFNKIIDELKDYEKITIILKDIISVKKKISKLTIEEQNKALLKYAKLLEIDKSKKNENNIILNLKWDNAKEAENILEYIINQTSNNVKKKIFDELLQEINETKEFILILDEIKKNFLLEQSLIAKELDIQVNIIDDELTKNLISSAGQNLKIYDNDYYTRGYKSIQKEIAIIEKRQYSQFDFLHKQLNLLKEKENMNLVYYNILSIKVEYSIETIIISVLLGLIVGIFYIIIRHKSQSQAVSAKRK
jgi:LPS O-antigen subunit length determinant protein (WzzB/FepE family)